MYVRIYDDAGSFVEEYMTHSLVGIGFRDGALHVIGTPHDDFVTIDNKHGSYVVHASFPVNLPYGPSQSDAILASHFRYDIRTHIVDSFVVDLGDGSDRLTSSRNVSVPVTAYGGANDDTLIVSGGPAILFGQDGNDYLQGGPSQDWLDGGDHDDRLSSLGADDYLTGGRGIDELDGGAGDDTADHGDGQDQFVGGSQPSRDMLIVNVNDALLDLANDFTDDLFSFEGIDLRDAVGTKLHVTPQAVIDATPSRNQVFLHVSDYAVVDLDLAWDLVTTSLTDGMYTRSYQSGPAQLEIAGPIDSTNPVNPLDVNGDQRQTAVDALQVINEISRGNLTEAEGEGFPLRTLLVQKSESWHGRAFLDVNADQQVTVLDALLVLNGLQTQAIQGSVAGEGEAVANVSDSSQIQQTPLQDKHGADRAGEDHVSGMERHDLERHNEQLYSLDAQGIESSADKIFQSAVDAEHENEFWQAEVEEFFADYDSMDSKLVVDLFGDRR